MAGGKSTNNQEKITSFSSKKSFCPWKTFLFKAVLFLATMFLGIFSAAKIIEIRRVYHIPAPEPVSISRFVFAFIFVTFFIIFVSFVLKRQRTKTFIFKFIFVFTIYFGGILTLGLWLGGFALLLMAFLVLLWLKHPFALLHNFCLVLAMAGLGSTLGLNFKPLMVVAFLVFFSIYDFIAVYKTKHMVKMAKEMVKSGGILGFVIPQKFSDFTASLKGVKPGGKFLILGGGDVVFPLLLAVSLVPQSIFYSLLVAIFSLIGLLFVFFIFAKQKTRQPIPALPPIALFSILGYLLTILI